MPEHIVRSPGGVIGALSAACAAYPDQRVMQVVVNALGSDPFYIGDDEAAWKLYDYAARASDEGRGSP